MERSQRRSFTDDYLIDRGTDAKWASRTSLGEESYVKVGSTLSNNAYSIT
jgi:hypothetical protein